MTERATQTKMTECAGDAGSAVLLGWSPEWVIAAIRARGTTLGDLARKLGVEKCTVGKIIRGQSTSRRLERAIARHIGVAPADIWPDRYPRGAR